MQEEIEQLQKKIKERLATGRYIHTVGVRYTAAALAMRYGVDLEKASLAGVLHDCAKYCSGDKMLEKAKKYQIPIEEVERQNPQLLHAKLGAYYARKRYGIEDEEILSAIRYHTTGRKQMTRLEQIVFLADYIEPHRKEIPGLQEVRKMAFVDIDRAVCMTLEHTLSYLESQTGQAGSAKAMDPNTMEAYQYYRALCDSKSKEGGVTI